MPIDWKDSAVKDRLLAAIIGSFDSSINCSRVADLFGPDATYHSIENFLRKPKKDAVKLKEEAAHRGPSTPSKPKTPKKNPDSVKSGRVTKTPKKGKAVINDSPIKKELLENELGFSTSGAEADIDGDMNDVFV